MQAQGRSNVYLSLFVCLFVCLLCLLGFLTISYVNYGKTDCQQSTSSPIKGWLENTLAQHTNTVFLLLLFCCQYPDDERVVKQFHFTAWPDHGVPSHPTLLLSLVRHTFSANRESTGPMVVHCRCGGFVLSQCMC